MQERRSIGYAIRFNETKQTFSHISTLLQKGFVLWGAWRKIDSVSSFGEGIKNIINNSKIGTTFYAIGQSTVLKMNVLKALSTEEVKSLQLTDFIPSYYSIDKPVYIWYLINKIEDLKNKDCLFDLTSVSGKSLIYARQIPGSLPWRVFPFVEN